MVNNELVIAETPGRRKMLQVGASLLSIEY